MILYFVRHGETDWNVKKKIQGKTDVPLNETGKQQAKELADMLLDRKKEGTLQVVRAYTSPQLRAAQTAQEAAIALDIPCIAADGLREMDMGDWEGRSWESITAGKCERVSGLGCQQALCPYTAWRMLQ